MNRRSSGPIWPAIGLLLALFALSITAPMKWNHSLPASGPATAASAFQSQVEPYAASQIDVAVAQADPAATAAIASTAAVQASDCVETPTVLGQGTNDFVPIADPISDQPSTLGFAIITPDAPFASPWYALAARPQWSPPSLDITLSQLPDTSAPVAAVPEPIRVGDTAELFNSLADETEEMQPTLATEAPVAVQPSAKAVSAESASWCFATEAMATLLAPLDGDAAFGDWATAVRESLGGLESADTLQAAVVQLRELEAKAAGLIAGHPAHPQLAHVRRARHALERRSLPWDLAAAASQTKRSAERVNVDWQAISLCLAQLQDGESSSEADAWRQRLLMESLEDLAMQNGARRIAADVVAREALDRISQELRDRRDQLQRETAVSLTTLAQQLRPLAASNIDPAAILADVESFEWQRSAPTAAKLADARARLAWADDPQQRALGDWLENHYQGGNFRVSISGRLLDRLTDQPATVEGPIRQMVLGVPTTGYSTTTTKVRYRLMPDDNHWRVAVVAEGQVAADTQASSGPARLFNRSDSTFVVQKEIELTRQGLVAKAAQANANSQTQLQGVESDFDWVPLVRKLAHNLIRKEYAARRGAARIEAQSTISRRAETEIDAQVGDRLERANAKFQQHILEPLERLGLDANANFQTSSDRLTARVRLAGPSQLAGHTPRPQAPGDSQASVQIHESALNNVLERLEVAGRTMTLAELFSAVCEKLNLGAESAPESMPSDVRVSMSAQQPIRVDLQGGQLKVTLSFAEIHHGSDHWRDFRVMVFYRPDLTQPGAPLVRDGVVQLDGKRVRAKGQVALRGVFSKMFPKDEPWQLMPEVLIGDRRLAGLTVTQFVIQDGWIGWAIGPAPTHTAQQAPPAARMVQRHDASRGVFLRRPR